MVYDYKRKTTQANWTEETMATALAKIGDQSIASVAKDYGIPYATLYRHWKNKSSKRKLGRFVPIFSNAQEIELKNYLKYMDTLFFGLSRSDFLKLAFDYAEANRLQHPFKNGKAGEDWLAKFRSRHPDITLRAPEATSIARARGFNRPQVERFYTVLWELLEKHKFEATSIYNMDETGIMSTSNKPPKIFTTRGKKQMGIIASSERGQLTTVICCCNAAGSFIPPYFVFARKRMQERLMDAAPPGSKGSCTDNGWVNGATFLLWLKHFVEIVRPTQKKCLLLLDNHESHKYYPALEYASQNNIIFLSFAPHTTNKMQPLDVSVYGPIKKFFEQELNTFQKNHVGRVINQYDMCRLFSPAYLKGATPQNAISGFNKPGIFPYNPNVFNEEDFAPATLTNRPCETPANINNKDLDNSSEDEVPLVHLLPKDKSSCNLSLASSTVFPASCSSVPSTSKPVPVADIPSSCISIIPNSKEADIALPVTPPKSVDISKALIIKPASTPCIHINKPTQDLSPFDVRPIPTMSYSSSGTRKRTCQKSEVLTSTPIKQQQLEKFESKSLKDKKKAATKPLFKKAVGKENVKVAYPKVTRSNVEKHSKSDKNCECLICGEPFNDTGEDWIQCSECKNWAHELCTNYSGYGSYFSDYCDE